MYCILEIKSSTLKKPYWIDKEEYYKIMQIMNDSGDLLDAIELFSFVIEAYEDLKKWCMHADVNAEYIMSNRHMAERKCRGFLMEIKTYFLQMKSKLKGKYGDDSLIYKMFVDAEENAKHSNSSFALVMDLKECANHCNKIIHSFVSSQKKRELQPCSIPSVLLSDFDGWNKNNRKYLISLSNNIDLLDLFESVCEVLKKIQIQITGYFLGTNNMGDRLLELREFMDNYFTKNNCTYFHLSHMVYLNKQDAPKVAFYQKKVMVTFDVYPIDWKVLYDLTDILKGEEGVK